MEQLKKFTARLMTIVKWTVAIGCLSVGYYYWAGTFFAIGTALAAEPQYLMGL
jgi:hypothetical protein